jgi:hypothetical protein
MNTIITKKTLNQSISFFSELDLNNNDFEIIYEKFKFLLENDEMQDIFRKISQMQKINTESDLKTIMKELITNLNLDDLNALLTKIIKNEPLIDYIQDLFLEKLL